MRSFPLLFHLYHRQRHGHSHRLPAQETKVKRRFKAFTSAIMKYFRLSFGRLNFRTACSDLSRILI